LAQENVAACGSTLCLWLQAVMGGGPLVAVHPNADSPTEPGLKSVVTDPIDGFCDPEALWDCLVDRMREPLWPREEAVLKELQIVDHGPEDFSIRVILDCQKLKALGWIEQLRWHGILRTVPDSEEVCRFCARVVADRQRQVIISTEFDPSDGTTIWNVTTTKFLRDPFRIEVFAVVVDGTRKHGPQLASFVQSCYLNPILRSKQHHMVRVEPNVDSPSGHGKAAITETVDKYFEAGTLLEDLIRGIQKAEHASNIEYLSESEFELTWTIQTPSAEDKDLITRQMRQVVRLVPDRGEIVVVSSVDTELIDTGFFRIHRDPALRVEHWSETGGMRCGGRAEADILSELVNGLIADAHSGKWLSWA